MNIYFFFVDGRYIFGFLMVDDEVRYRLLDIFGKKDREIFDYLMLDWIMFNGYWNFVYFFIF